MLVNHKGGEYNPPMPARERSFRVEALVLRHADWGEADRMLTLFTRERGKLRAVAKGVRRERSRKAGHLEPFTRVHLLLARGREIPIITQAETVDAYLSLRQDLKRVGQASYIVELIDRFTYEDEENTGMFRLLADSLSHLAAGDEASLVLRYYEMRLLDLIGFRPKLFNCAQCDNDIQPEDQYFSAQAGGVLCPNCGAHAPGSTPVTMTALRYLRHMQRSSYSEAKRAAIPPAANREMESLMEAYLTYLLERTLNAPKVMRRIARGEPQEERR